MGPIIQLLRLLAVAIPAQLTAIVTLPNYLTVNSTNCLTFSSSVTLVLKNLTLSETSFYPASSFKSATTTLTPKLTKASTQDSPIPDAPPVTIAT